MENNVCEKTESGYILHQHNASTIVVVVCVLCLGLIYPVDALVKRVDGAPQFWNVWVIAGVFLACVALAVVVLRTEWCRMVIDDQGIRFHRPLAKAKFIAWENVWDWGIAHKRTRYGLGYILYFSTEPLKPTCHGKNKKIPFTYQKAVSVDVGCENVSFLQRTGVISFCRQCLEQNHTSTKKLVPVFMSDMV